ncbi:MAG: response regulator [Chloroflexota bacterium]
MSLALPNVRETPAPHVLIADPDPATRKALALLLSCKLNLVEVREAESVEGLIQALAAYPPDILLLDWSLYGSQAPAMSQLLHKAYPNLKIVLLSVNLDDTQLANQAGASFIWKGAPAGEVLAGIKALL